MRRCFTQSQKLLLLRQAGYRCCLCGVKLSRENFAADHRFPYAKGGITEAWNGQALCVPCNSRKGERVEGGADGER
ncbi:MAG: HNH endonuclease [Microcystaceae cyanobacterium]